MRNHAVNITLIFNEQQFSFLNRLDGETDPYKIYTGYTPEEIDDILAILYRLSYIRYGRLIDNSIGNLSILVRECNSEKLSRKPFLLADCMMRLLWLPILVFGIWYFAGHWKMIDGSETALIITFGNVFGLVTGIVLHELAHAVAGIAMGAELFCLGVGTSSFLPCAFVIMNTSRIRSRAKKFHIDEVGIEMNLLLAGLYLFLSCVIPKNGNVFFIAAIFNAIVALSNLIPWKGSDGMHMLSEVFGSSDLYEYAENAVKNQKKRRKLLRSGTNGLITMGCSLVIMMLQVTVPVFLVLNVVMWIL